MDSTQGNPLDDLSHYMEATSRLKRERDGAVAEADRLREALTRLTVALEARTGGTMQGGRVSWHFDGEAFDEVLAAHEAAAVLVVAGDTR